MKKNSKGDKKMNTLTLNQIESRVKANSSSRNDMINKFSSNIKKKNLNKGRVRPKNPTEANILSLFTRK